MAGGFIGNILKMNLSLGNVYEEVLDENIHKAWLGGYGLGATRAREVAKDLHGR